MSDPKTRREILTTLATAAGGAALVSVVPTEAFASVGEHDSWSINDPEFNKIIREVYSKEGQKLQNLDYIATEAERRNDWILKTHGKRAELRDGTVFLVGPGEEGEWWTNHPDSLSLGKEVHIGGIW